MSKGGSKNGLKSGQKVQKHGSKMVYKMVKKYSQKWFKIAKTGLKSGTKLVGTPCINLYVGLKKDTEPYSHLFTSQNMFMHMSFYKLQNIIHNRTYKG